MDAIRSPEFREGQVVHVVTERVNKNPGWVYDMDQYFGMEARITHISEDEDWVRLDIDDGNFWWGYEMLQEFYGPYTSVSDREDAEIASIMESLLGEFKVHERNVL